MRALPAGAGNSRRIELQHHKVILLHSTARSEQAGLAVAVCGLAAALVPR